MAGTHMMKRIPLIKFPQRHSKGASAGTASQVQVAPSGSKSQEYSLRSEVPASPTNTAVGGKASLQPKRTPVTEKEIEAILLGGCF
ncbi:hypothetical protein AAC387_Pa01g2678 [Persea americana]